MLGVGQDDEPTHQRECYSYSKEKVMYSYEIDIFFKEKKERSEKMIDYGIWRGVHSDDLGAWLKNFTSDEERFFAACILDWLVYRNDEHVVSMLYDLLTKHLHNQWRLDGNSLYNEEQNPLIMARNKWQDPGFRYVTAVTMKDKDTKSGYHIARYLNQKLGISTYWNIRCSEINEAYQNGIRTFLFADDIIGTGEQMNNVLSEAGVDNYNDIFVYVLVCAAHEEGIKTIHEKYPLVRILYAELIPKDSSVFIQFPTDEMGFENAEALKTWYINFMKKNGVAEDKVLGRGDLGLVYAFESNVPNDSLPLLYYENNKLRRLMQKRG